MPSSYTTSLRIELPATGELVNTWGIAQNQRVFQRFEDAIAGLNTIALTANYVLTTSNTGSEDARYAMLKFTGTGPYTVTIPSVSKSYKVWNACTAALTFTTGGGTTVVVDATDIVEIFCDATNVKTLGFSALSLKDYIASVVVGGGAALPSVVGNAGKWTTNNGVSVSWAYPTTSSLSDITAYTQTATNLAAAFAVAL